MSAIKIGVVVCGGIALTADATVSKPYSDKGDISNIIPDYQDVKVTEKKYHDYRIENLHETRSMFNTETMHTSCQIGVQSKWSSPVGSGVFASPVTYPSGIDGKKEIFVNTFYQYVEVLGHDGFKPWGFPLSFEDSSFQTSPVLYDVDNDGTNDMGVVDKNGNLYWIRLGEFGQYLEDYHVQIPKLKIKRDWADGMDPKFVDNYVLTSMFDHDYAPFQKTGSKAKHDELESLSNEGGQVSYPEQSSAGADAEDVHRRRLSTEDEQNQHKMNAVKRNHMASMHDNLGEKAAKSRSQGDVDTSHEEASGNGANNEGDSRNHNFESQSAEDVHAHEDNGAGKSVQPPGHALHIATPDELIRDTESLPRQPPNSELKRAESHPFRHPGGDDHDDRYADDDANTVTAPPEDFIDDDYTVDAEHAYQGRHHYGIHGDDMSYMGYGDMGGYNESNFVYVDPHVLSSPVLVDVNNDGDSELVMAVSYYFDKYSIGSKDELDYDPNNYIAGGIASWNIAKEEWSWLVHLDLTTDKTKFNALIFASPTVADIDGDGRKEVIIGTSLGLLYVLDGDSGFTRRFFPMQFHQIQAQVAVGDIVGGPSLEMIVGDLVGNLVCVNSDGDVVWDARLSGAIYHAATIGDVDGDGQLDVVVSVAALEGYQIYAVRGDTGKILPKFPISLPASAEISGPILLVDVYSYMNEDSARKSYTAGVPGGTISSEKSRSYGTSSSNYDDPYVPKWTMDTRGHEPAPAPSENVPRTEPDVEETADGGRRLSSMRGSNKESDSKIEKGSLSEREYANQALSAEELKNFMARKKSNVNKPQMTKNVGLHLLVPSFDGHLYLLDGQHTCAERIDIGEHIMSTPLLDDIDANGLMDIVVGTLHGTVHVLETQIPYHPLNAWTSFPKDRGNGFTHGQIGVSIPSLEKKRLRYSDVKGGALLEITFDIWDTRKSVENGLENPTYSIVFTKGTNKMEQILREEYHGPGRYSVSIPVAPPGEDSLVLGMYTDHGLYFEDHVDVAISTRFYVWLKYMLLFPLAVLAVPLLLMRSKKDSF
mmetsp:Transcript_10831/g.20033  ORF Transcript_10831/g.20033 Transcript_10831/m.20033 type:complete len:1046 (+) Transcript_10831:90-3227(+)